MRIEDLQIRNSQNGILLFGDGSIIRNCIVEAGVLNGISAGGNALIEHCISKGGAGSGISASQNSVIRNCTAEGNAHDGIAALQGSTIENCVARGNLRYGISIAGGVIRGCAAYENGITDPPPIQGDTPLEPGSFSIDDGPGGEAIVRYAAGRAATTAGLSATNGAVIVDSVARGNLGDGIQLSSNLMASSVINSTSAANGAAGVLTHSSGGQILGCTIDDNDGEGIRIESNGSATISNCLVRESGSDGIRIFVSSFSATTIVDSTILLNGADGVNTAQRTSIEGTSISNNNGNGVNGNADTRISTCQITSNTLNGVSFLSRSTIVNSVVNGNGGAGVLLIGLDNMVDQNRIGGNAGAGVLLQAGSQFNQVTRNSLIADIIFDGGLSNRVGTVVGTPVGAGAWDNLSF